MSDANQDSKSSDQELDKVKAGAVSDDSVNSIAGGRMVQDEVLKQVAGGAISDDQLDGIAGGRKPTNT